MAARRCGSGLAAGGRGHAPTLVNPRAGRAGIARDDARTTSLALQDDRSHSRSASSAKSSSGCAAADRDPAVVVQLDVELARSPAGVPRERHACGGRRRASFARRARRHEADVGDRRSPQRASGSSNSASTTTPLGLGPGRPRARSRGLGEHADGARQRPHDGGARAGSSTSSAIAPLVTVLGDEHDRAAAVRIGDALRRLPTSS